MDFHNIIVALTTKEIENDENFDEKLQIVLERAFVLIPEKIQTEINEDRNSVETDCSIRWKYLHTLLYVLNTMQRIQHESPEACLSVSDVRSIKTAIETVVSMGILPFLLPRVGFSIHKLYPKAMNIPLENLTDIQKYKRLSHTVRILSQWFTQTLFKTVVFAQLGPLISGLLQLSYVPLMKPSESTFSSSTLMSNQFVMTAKLYMQLRNEQEEFQIILKSLINNCPGSAIIKELMIVLGVKNAPKWLRIETRKCLIDIITQSNGVLALVLAVCDDILDLGAHWGKLDIVALLLATSQEADSQKYFESVCSQLVDLLKSKSIRHASTIASYCIRTLYLTNDEICTQKIIHVIAAPLLSKTEKLNYTEEQLTECIENLSKCFTTSEANFKSLPSDCLQEFAIPLFRLYVQARKSILALRNTVQELLLVLLSDAASRNTIFSVFLEDNSIESYKYFGEKLSFALGPSGGFQIIKTETNISREELSDSLMDLIKNDNNLLSALFTYLLNSLVHLKKPTRTCDNRLETPEDTIEFIEKRVVTIKLLSQLAATPSVQQAQLENPEALLAFIKSLFGEKNFNSDAANKVLITENDMEALYIGLMLIQMILTERGKPKDWKPFTDLLNYLTGVRGSIKEHAELNVLIEELIIIIKTKGKSVTRHYEDMSVDSKKSSEYEKAIKDLADPLLPIRAHGLIVLTKLIESRDPNIMANKDIILCFFQENLKDDDSFIYLAAINGLCALALLFPDKLIQVLIQEYISMPTRSGSNEIPPETRSKLGEVLVKVTRALGEMAQLHRNVLINAFLCGTRDPEPLVRASSLSCLGELCKVLGFRLGNIIVEVLYCIGCIIKTDKALECRRAGVLVATLLLRGLGKDALRSLGSDLVTVYRGLIHLRDTDDDPVLRLHAQLALEELDDIVKDFLFSNPKLQKNIFLLHST
ncbi:transport and Golgi organization protein 6 homolog [Cephus cinctus]|uniref:Transport and Golgi organization protein 6 homolog n=1 Tax=Cephus cinctus TaxID=211228 RepID=A0AAJ7FND1_CEPCN|nr:transport and Golgi organization protein 6 homolog [Cephus cinctus]XP_015600323.1 transport and Golgi organization protein 6 homolog [Cephus cinctus]